MNPSTKNSGLRKSSSKPLSKEEKIRKGPANKMNKISFSHLKVLIVNKKIPVISVKLFIIQNQPSQVLRLQLEMPQEQISVRVSKEVFHHLEDLTELLDSSRFHI